MAHVNYLFFLSTQSFIYHYLSHLQRFRPICLTREPESPAIRPDVAPELASSFYLHHPRNGAAPGRGPVWSAGLKLRRTLTRLPPSVGEPTLRALHDWVVPRLHAATDAACYERWVSEILQRQQARLIHAYFAPLGWRLLALKRQLGLPLVVTFLGDDVAETVASWWWWLIQTGSRRPDWPARLRELLAEGDLFLVEGPYLRQRLIEMGCPPDRIEVQRIGLPIDEMVPRGPARQPPDGPLVILFAGRFCEQKGLLYALEAVHQLRREGRRIEFRIIGDDTLTDGRCAAPVYAYIRRHRLESCVRLLGFLNHADYLRELRAADVFLHPSIVDDNGISEGGAPTTILEAQALAVPVVSTVHCDIPNVTVPGESALLVPERDSTALARALGALLDDPQRRLRMGRAGREFVAAHHDIACAAPLLEERYARLLEQRRHRAAR